MPLTTNERFLYKSVPEGASALLVAGTLTDKLGIPIPGETTQIDISTTIDLENVPLAGGFLRELVAFGLEAHIRLRMQPPGSAASKDATVSGDHSHSFSSLLRRISLYGSNPYNRASRECSGQHLRMWSCG